MEKAELYPACPRAFPHNDTFPSSPPGQGGAYGNRRLGKVRGQRYRLTINGTKSAWQRMRADAGVTDFRFHDYRHDFGSKLLRESGNLKLVQKAMNHRDIKSTLRYAHVLDTDVATAVDAVAKSRTKSRSAIRKVS